MKQLSVLIGLMLSPLAEAAEWLRYPAISPNGKTIVFTHAGDLYTVSSTGGQAVPLTQHVGRDFMPVWSPDGQSIAFASSRHGNYDVYQISAAGGKAERLTYYSKDDLPSAITSDGWVIFESVRQDPVESLEIPSKRLSELYRVPLKGGRVERVFSTPAENISFSEDGSKFLYHDRKGYEDPWRKHHTSSIARDIWLYESEGKSHRKITSFEGEDRNPVWLNENEMLYLSEQSGSFNVWQRGLEEGAKPRQVTSFQHHPVRFLSRAQTGMLAYGYHGSIYVQDGVSGEPERLEIQLRTGEKTNTSLVSHAESAKEISVSPDGAEVAFIVRGEIFVTSVDYTATRRITNTPEQERSVDFHPDGNSLVYASERDGSWNLYTKEIVREEELYFYEATAMKETPLLVTEDETFQPQWSPDGKKVAFLKDRVQLCVLDVESKEVTTLLDGSQSYSYSDGDLSFSWSPNGKNILFMLLQKDRWAENIVMVPAEGQGEVIDLSKNGYYDMAPKWGWDGEGVTWVSNRHGRKAHGSWGSDRDVYAGFLTERALRYYEFDEAGLESFETEEEEKEEDAKKAKEGDDSEKKDSEEEDEKRESDIFFEAQELDAKSVEDRIRRLTIHSTELKDYSLSADGKNLYYLSLSRGKVQIWKNKLHTSETKILATLGKAGDRDAFSLEIDPDGETLFVLAAGKIQTVDTDKGEATTLGNGGEMNLDLAAEREQMFDHVWRQVREKFHRKDFHGVDWDFYGKEYRKFLPAIHNNDDFAEMLSELLGELDASHTGAFHRPKHKGAARTASLGVFYDFNFSGPGIRILEVIPRSPLDLLDEDVPAGTIIKEINGKPLAAGENFYQALDRLANERTLLTLALPDGTEREEVILPITLGQEAELLYQRWTKRMRAKAEELSDGKIGWVHIRGMNDGAFREFFSRVFGYHADKKALIVDTRFNGGGWLTEDLTTFLSGERFLKFYPRGQGNMGGEPIFRWSKPSAVIMSEGNYSDAHLFPYAYSALEIGKLVGMPVPGTGTAVWWERLIDSTVIFGIPQVSTIDKEGRYLENTQLEPDLKVANTPEDREKGRDRQLETAVKHLMSLPEEKPWPLPKK